MCGGLLVGVDVGVVRCLRLHVEGGEVVLRMDAPGEVRCGVASGRGRCEAVVEGCARGSFLPLMVLVHVHAGGPCGGPSLAMVRLCGSPLASSLCFLVLVPTGRGVGRGGLFPFRLVRGFSGKFLVSL